MSFQLIARMRIARTLAHIRAATAWLVCLISATIGLTSTRLCASAPTPADSRAAFIEHMHHTHHLDYDTLRAWLPDNAAPNTHVLDRIRKPTEHWPWWRYRRLFLTSERIQQGVRFGQQHAATLARAEATYGVPPSIIVAILGVETQYGQRTGRHNVLDALHTLAFYHPPRARFFQRELEAFLILCRTQGWNPHDLQGSYAGALGWPQFMPTSYQRFGVDFSQDGHVDLLHNPIDAIGSVAHFLAQHGWEPHTLIAMQTCQQPDRWPSDTPDLRPTRTLQQWQPQHILPTHLDPKLAGHKAALLTLHQPEHDEHWLGLQNFYALSRYNHSKLYVMAVAQLAQAMIDATPDDPQDAWVVGCKAA